MNSPLEYPSVTEVLRPWEDWSIIPPHVLEVAALRGSEVHSWIRTKLTAHFAPYELLGPMKDILVPYCESWKQWADLALDKVLVVEAGIYCNCFHYYGHLDCVAMLKGDAAWTLLDWKTPILSKRSWISQLSAYKHLVEGHLCICGHEKSKHGFQDKPGCLDCDCREYVSPRIARTGVVKLKKDGKPATMEEYTGETLNAFNAFKSSLMAGRFLGKWK